MSNIVPSHFSRYCGYCPQFKYQIGETFGRTTSSLLTDSVDNVASSGRPVLADIEAETKPPKADNRREVIATRTFSLGDQKLTDQMVPGYTGIFEFRWNNTKSIHCIFGAYLFQSSCLP